jgi:putative transcriptional regulator
VLKMLEQQVQGSNSTGSVDFMASGSVEKTPRATAMPSLLVNLLNADDFDALPWKKTIAPGLKQIVLDCDEGQARLLRIAAGQKMPVHSHRGNELTLILKGGYSDAVGEFHAGDVADLDGSTEHQPVAFDDMDCICLAGMDAPLAFKGWLAKLIQPFVGM